MRPTSNSMRPRSATARSALSWLLVAATSGLGLAGLAYGWGAESNPTAEPPTATARQAGATAPALQDARLIQLTAFLADPARPRLSAQEHAAAIELVRDAGTSGDRSRTAILWNLADRTSEGDAQLVALEALDALWRLGEPATEFVARLDTLRTTPNLAHFSATVLGRSLRREHLERIEALARETQAARLPQANLFGWAALRAREAAGLAARLDAAPTLHQKIDEISPWTLGDYSPFGGTCGGIEVPLTSADPVTAFARERLLELSAAAPAAAVQALLACDMGGKLTPELVPDETARQSILDSFRDHMAQHLAPAARAEYSRHRPEAFAHESHR